MKKKNLLLLTFFVATLFLTAGIQNAFAAACISGGGSCYETNNCSTSSDGGKDLTSVPAGDAVCASVYEAPVKCCKKVTTASTDPSATKKGGDTATSSSTKIVNFTNPLEFTTVEGFLGGILSAIQKIIAVLALVFIMIGAVMILTSAGNSGMVEKGKGAITMALVGLALGVAAPSLLKELARIIGWGSNCASIADAGIKAACLATEQAVGGALTLSQIAVNVLNFLLGTMGILALVMMVIGAIMYLTSAGDEERVEKGKDIFKYSIIGLILAMSAMVLVTQIAKFFVSPTAGTTAGAGARKPMPAVPGASAVPSDVDQANACASIGYDDEVCTIMDKDPSRSGQYLMPVGKVCVWRKVCPNSPMQGCCKPEVDMTGL